MENKNERPPASATTSQVPHDILVVTSRLKNYIRDKSTLNTAGEVPDLLSDRIRSLCDQAIEHARQDGRKTVMDRDFPTL